MSEYHINLHRTPEPSVRVGRSLSAQKQTHLRSSEGDGNYPMHNERLHQSMGGGLDSRSTNQSATQGGGKDDSAINYGRDDRVVAKPYYPNKSSSFHIESTTAMPKRSPSLHHNNNTERVNVAAADDIAKRLLTLNAWGKTKLHEAQNQNQPKADLVPIRETVNEATNYCSSSSPNINGKGNNNKTMGFGATVIPPPPPPPPPPPRPTSLSAGRVAQQPLRENHVGASQPSADSKKNSSLPSMRTDNSNTFEQTNAVNDDRLPNNRCNNKPPNLLHASFSSACSGSGGESSGKEKESNIIKPSPGKESGEPVVKGILHKNTNNKINGRSMYTNVNNQKGTDMASSQPNIEENEVTTSQFNKFASMSLNDLDKPLNKNMKGNNKSDNNNKHEELNHSSMSVSNVTGFSPRPIRITQFDDSLESPNNSDNKSPGTSRYKGMTTTTTTESFVNSIREGIIPLPFEKITKTSNNNIMLPMSSTPRESTPLTSIYKPPQNKTPASAATSATSDRIVESLPDTVDKKGRCLRHPNIKLFKKKTLRGGYEMIRESCPNCIEEAPYESLWRGRAKTKLVKTKQCDGPPRDSFASGGERSSSGSIDNEISNPGRSRSVDSLGRMGSAIRSVSRERRSRSKSKERRVQDTIYKPQTKSVHLAKRTVRPHPPPPPPPQSSRRASGDLSPPTPSRRIDRGRQRRPSGAISVNSMNSEHTPASVQDQSSPINESKSLFEKGIDTLSSLQNRTRSSSRKRREAKSTASARSARSAHDESFAASHQSLGQHGSGILSISDTGLKLSPHSTKKSVANVSEHGPKLHSSSGRANVKANVSSSEASKKLKFDKKTGRCKYHPSVILAKKSKFSKGWDIIKDGCPFCIEARSETSDQFGEISKKMMSALLGGAPVDTTKAYPSPVESYDASKSETSDRSKRHKSSSHKQQVQVVDSYPRKEDGSRVPERVSRMPYTAPWGESGWYTGEVNSSGKPHGNGRMRCKTGKSIGGEWTNGYSEEFLENKGRIKSGFGTNVAPWKEDPRLTGGSSGAGHTAQAQSSNKQQPPLYQGQQYQQQQPQPYYGGMPYMPVAYGQPMYYPSTAPQQQRQQPQQQQQQQQTGDPNAYHPGYHQS